MGRLLRAVGLRVGVGMIAACGTEELSTGGEPSAGLSIGRETPEVETPDPETATPFWSADGKRILYVPSDGNCFVPASRLAELADHFGESFQDHLRVRSPDGQLAVIPCDDELRAQIESVP